MNQTEKDNKRKLILCGIVTFLSLLSFAALIVLSEQLAGWSRIATISIGIAELAGGMAVAVVLDWWAGTYECRQCNAHFVPTIGAYLFGPHFFGKRKLKCPHCGAVGYCKRVLSE